MRSGETSAIGKRSTLKGSVIFIVDSILYIVFLSGAVIAGALWLKLVLGLCAGLAISFLFLVGHDACHHSLTPNKRLNKIIGRLAFLPSYHPFSLWDLGHNKVHHRFTNLRTKDYVWRPLSKEEYDRAPLRQRLAYRFYRTPLGCLFYFLIDVWLTRMFFFELTVTPKKPIYSRDRLLVVGFILVQVGFVLSLDYWWRGQVIGDASHYAMLGLYALAIPFLLWNCLASLLIFLHHTHPSVRWHNTEEEWRSAAAQLESSVHWVFPEPVDWALHRIMDHTAHHVNPALPLYDLKRAQASLEQENEEKIIVEKWSIRTFLDIVSRCKLYDFDRHAWTDFQGNLTTTPLQGAATVK